MLLPASAFFTGFLARLGQRQAAPGEPDPAQRAAHFRALVDNAPDPVLIVGEHGVIRYGSPATSRVWGYADDALAGSAWYNLIHPEDMAQTRFLFDQIEECPGTNMSIEARVRYGDGSWNTCELIANNLLADEEINGFVITARDISERKRYEEQLTRLAFHDPLSNLPNRALFISTVQHALARAERLNNHAALLFLDLDNFKVVNDSLGHRVGDHLLVAVAERLRLAVRPIDTVARLGGDEFTVLLEDVADIEQASSVAERIIQLLHDPFTIDGHQVFTAASIGIALSTPGCDKPDELLRDADLAMYQAKAGGKSGYTVFDRALGELARSRLDMETDLRRALELEEFRIHYQPVMDLESKSVREVEALLRWQHPRRGLVQPGDFIPIAEETGLILSIGQWVLDQACLQAVAWQRQMGSVRPLQVSVNLSPRQFQDPKLVAKVRQALQNSGLEPSCLKLEITESMMMQHSSGTVALIQDLKQLGVELAIDDFGTGYCSLNYLKRFPVDTLKIDRSFVSGLGQNPEDTAIVRAVIAFAKALNMTVTGEGIETSHQLDDLNTLHCQRGQGNYFSKPLPAETMAAWLNQRRPITRPLAPATCVECSPTTAQNATNVTYSVLVNHTTNRLTSRLREFGGADAADLATTLLAAFAVYVGRFTGQDTVHLVVSASNKQCHDCAAGPAVLATIEADLNAAGPFRPLLDTVRQQLGAALDPYAAGDYAALRFTYGRLLDRRPQADAQQHPRPEGDLWLEIAPDGEQLTLRWGYNGERLEDSIVAAMHGQFTTLLEGIVADEAQPIAGLPLLTRAERRQLVETWNDTAAPYPDKQTISQLFEEQARLRPQEVAVVFGDQALTYAALNSRANQLAHFLRGLGVGPETPVGICVERSLELVVGVLGVLKAGGAYVPLDPTYPTERLAYMIDDARMPVLLTQTLEGPGRSPIDAATADLPADYQPVVLYLDRDWPLVVASPASNPPNTATPDNLAYLIYTSGSTGRPKGVLLQQRGLVNLVYGQLAAFAITAASRVLQFASFSFDASVSEIFTALCAGARLYLAPRDTLVSPPDLLALLRSERITTVTLPPSLLALLPAEDLPDLATVVSAGEGCSWEIALRWAAGRRFLNAYGPTEATIGPTAYVVGAMVPGTQTVPIGRPLPNYQLYLLDRSRQPVPVGAPGEVYIGGVGLARGYFKQPELTAERFVEWTPEEGGAPVRLYRTGDLARYLPDGNVEFLGRIDHQVKLRGFRIEPGEIEAVLRQHAAVQDAIVLVREDQPGDRRLVAYVTERAPGAVRSGELRAHLQRHLTDYMVPSAFVVLPHIPLTVNGKVDRRALPAPEVESAAPTEADAPRNAEEAALAEIWARVLGRPHVGIHDSFFALGGHSLLAARAMALVNAALGRNIPLRVLFDAPTVAGFAAAVNQDAAQAAPAPTDLAAEVALDPAISALDLPPARVDRAEVIFLTGATGFVGAFLLNELLTQTPATIHCLVRAATTKGGRQRIRQTLTQYGVWREEWASRIVPVIGDLGQPRFGLSAARFARLAATVDVIYHAGAQVHYLHSYETLRSSNVGGTVEVVRLACQERVKPVHYISTLAVAADPGVYVREDDELPACNSPVGYIQSKWVAEGIMRLARERGVPVSIYRPERIGCQSQTAVSNEDDFFVRLLGGCIQLGLAPDLPMVEDLMPVDFVTQAIVYLSRQAGSANRTFHLLNPTPTRWQWVVAMAQELGYPLRLAPYGEWHRALLNAVAGQPGHPLNGLLLLMPQDLAAAAWVENWTRGGFDTQNAVAGLAASGLKCPPFDAPLLQKMLADGVRRGLFAAPAPVNNGFQDVEAMMCVR